jgi:hypothetical protein
LRTSVFQPWVTIQGTAQTVVQITQDEADWLDGSSASDVQLWIDVRSASPLSSGSLTLRIESSPTKDEAFFAPVAVLPLLAATSAPIVLKTVSGATSVNPVARWLRWTIVSVGSGSGQWSVTFRIRVGHARAPSFTPTMVPGCVRWLRSDLGVTLDTSQSPTATYLTSWVDQAKGVSFAGKPSGASAPTLVPDVFNGFPGILTSITNASYLEGATSLNIAQPNSTLIVFQAVALQTTVQLLVAGTSGGEQNIQIPISETTEITGNAGTPQTVTVSSVLSASILQVDWNTTATQFYQNGAALGSPVNAGSANSTFIIAGASGSGANNFSGYFAEIIMFNQLLTPAWRTLITRYLGNRYAISVP